MTTSVTVSHTFEAGHRLPHIGGKCVSLHGHSWRVEVTVTADEPDPNTGIVANFTHLKSGLRRWIDGHLDHGLMLGREDELIPVLARRGKVYVFGVDTPDVGDSIPVDSYLVGEVQPDSSDLEWPSVENVARLLARVAEMYLANDGHPLGVEGAYVSSVTVSETPTNSATWEAPIPLGQIVEVGEIVIDAKLRVRDIEFNAEVTA